MAHKATGMAGVQDPSERFGQIIGGVKDAGNVTHDNFPIVFPILNREVLYEYVSRAFSWNLCVDHFYCRFVIVVHRCRGRLFESKFTEDGAEILDLFGRTHSSVEFSLGRASCG